MEESKRDDLAKKAIDYVHQMQQAACRLAEEITEQAQTNMNSIIESAIVKIDQIDKDNLSVAKKEIDEICQDSCKAITEVKEDTIHRVKDKWDMSRMQIQNSVLAVKENFEMEQIDVEKDVNDIIKYVNNLVSRCIKTIKNHANEATNKIHEIQKRSKKELKSSD